MKAVADHSGDPRWSVQLNPPHSNTYEFIGMEILNSEHTVGDRYTYFIIARSE